MAVRVQAEDFDVAREIAALRRNDRRVGAIATFIGTVRDVNDDATVSTLTLEHYPGMTERALTAIVDEAKQRFDVYDVLVIHRVGTLAPCDQIVMVAVTGAHRGEAFDACRFVMDYLKTRAPFWKKERTPQGDRWVEARASDDDAAAAWSAVAAADQDPGPTGQSA
jgi:molybdopterin synthase catalytic subunit